MAGGPAPPSGTTRKPPGRTPSISASTTATSSTPSTSGNSARWINHACEPNCEADEIDGRVFIQALRDISREELFYDYGLFIDERYTPKLKKQFECRCGSKKCRGTMLAPKR
jgi:hypothetical protein